VVIAPAIRPRFVASNPTENYEFLKAIKIRSMTSFRGKVKPSAPCRKILQHVKDHHRYEKNTS
jgi:hypothetical protein